MPARGIAGRCLGVGVGEGFIPPPGMLAAAGNIRGASGKQAFTGALESGSTAPCPCTANRRLRAAAGRMPGPYRAALGQMLPVLQPQGGAYPIASAISASVKGLADRLRPRRLRAEPSPSTPDPAIGRTCTGALLRRHLPEP